MPYELFITAEFSAAHNLRHYKGKCERLHGHNWRVDLRLEGTRLGREGMLMDFVEAKRILAEVIDPLDHAYLNEAPPFDRLNPSSENLARIIAEAVAKRVPKGVRVASVTCWESARCAATYKQTKVQSSKFKVQS
ncbi:MAG: 6-carboxytetrahydropterin synthase QueD [Planctomycetota bacterium]|nr:6-carboxytetrahydropterin synthase QueD [Planctomycetota bacterium]